MDISEKTIIGVSGKARSGKDTVAEFLTGFGFIRCALADKLKKFAYMLGWDGKKDEKGRRFLQHLGTVVREYDEDGWIKLLEKDPKFMGAERVVITDIRYPNEAFWVQNAYGQVVRIEGRGGLEGEAAKHPSETSLDNFFEWDFIVDNSGGFPELQEQLSILLRSVIGV